MKTLPTGNAGSLVLVLALLYFAIVGFASLVVAPAIVTAFVTLLSAIGTFVLSRPLAALAALLVAALLLVLAALLAGGGAWIFVASLTALATLLTTLMLAALLAALLAGRLLGGGYAAALVILIGPVALVGVLLVGILLLSFRGLTASRVLRVEFVFFLGSFACHGVSPFIFKFAIPQKNFASLGSSADCKLSASYLGFDSGARARWNCVVFFGIFAGGFDVNLLGELGQLLVGVFLFLECLPQQSGGFVFA